MYKRLIRPLLFMLPAETAHHVVMNMLIFIGKLPLGIPFLNRLFVNPHPLLERTVAGIHFPSPVGLAAGLDKDARAFRELGALGFGFIEVGTVTPLPQPGNPKPRLFRLPSDQALVNRMGFNNDGLSAMVNRLRKRKGKKPVIGGNIGKNKVTPNESADADYLRCFAELYPWVDYFVINISSPNTPGLRELQEKEPLGRLLRKVSEANASTGAPKPLFLKIAPDLTSAQVDDIVDLVIQSKLAGMIISNTTTDRSGLRTPEATIEEIGPGGLSGLPLFERSTQLVRYVSGKANGRFSIIASGGIFSGAQALEKLKAGADLVQLYTGFVYEGPGLIREIHKSIVNS